mmetsp:Transcript_19279/g.68533  ORF Transcript_19279/g.68533 Transcript_19279/m.68533 type:complete len:206 (-) Transcript_19279:316-933(-)
MPFRLDVCLGGSLELAAHWRLHVHKAAPVPARLLRGGALRPEEARQRLPLVDEGGGSGLRDEVVDRRRRRPGLAPLRRRLRLPRLQQCDGRVQQCDGRGLEAGPALGSVCSGVLRRDGPLRRHHERGVESRVRGKQLDDAARRGLQARQDDVWHTGSAFPAGRVHALARPEQPRAIFQERMHFSCHRRRVCVFPPAARVPHELCA